MIENPLENRPANRLVQLEAEIDWPSGIGWRLIDDMRGYSKEDPPYVRIGVRMAKEAFVLREKVYKNDSSELLSQLISGYLEVIDILSEAESIDGTDNQFDDYYMSALKQAEIHLRGNSILQLIRSDPTGVNLLKQNKMAIETSDFPEGIKRGFARGYDRYMQILNYLQE